VEDVLGVAATLEGRTGLKALTQMDELALDALLKRLQATLAPETLAVVSQPAPDRPLGLLLTEEQRRSWPKPDQPDPPVH
jgi:hypothetical protein